MGKRLMIGVFILGIILVNLVGMVSASTYTWEKISTKPSNPTMTCGERGTLYSDNTIYNCLGSEWTCDPSNVGKKIIDGQLYNIQTYYECVEQKEGGFLNWFVGIFNNIFSRSQEVTTINKENEIYKITKCEELNLIKNDLAGSYELTKDIDCLGITNFKPIGLNSIFTGTFDGKEKIISNLNIDFNEGGALGLFSSTSSSAIIKNVILEDVNIKRKAPGTWSPTKCEGILGGVSIGSLVGENLGTIENVKIINGNIFQKGSIDENNPTCFDTGPVGGLVGWNKGNIKHSYFDGDVYGETNVGGLVGYNIGTISESFSLGDGLIVIGISGSIGGLVGINTNEGIIKDTYSRAKISHGKRYSGGLVGENYGSITNSYATGNIEGIIEGYAGGLVGKYNSVKVENSFAVGKISNGDYAGGLIGEYIKGTITNLYWFNTAGDLAEKAASVGTISSITQDLNYFKGDVYPNNQPMAKWDFNNIWSEVTSDFPKLRWEGGGTPVTPTTIAQCGSANGLTDVTSETTLIGMGLCVNSGNIASEITGGIGEPWSWTCKGTDQTLNCEAYAPGQTPINTANCGTLHTTQVNNGLTISTPGLCKTGIATEFNFNLETNKWTWKCGSSSCWATKTTIVTCDNDNKIDSGEQCDGTNVNKQTCAGVKGDNAYTGTLLCKSDCSFDTSRCEKKGDGGVAGVCNVNIINDKNIKNFNQLSDKINELGGCSLGLFSNFKPESTSNDNKVWLWDCGTTAHCSFTIEEDYKDILQTYVIDGNCDDPANQGFINIKLNEGQPDEYTRKVYCPAPLSFFTFWNIVAVLVVIGVVYVIMQHSKGKRKR